MRITKQLAEEISVKLTEKKSLKIKEHNQKIKDYVTELILSKTPKEVIELSNKHPSFFDEDTSFRFNSEDFKWEWFYTNMPIASNRNHYEISKEENKKLFELVQKIEKLKKELKDLTFEIYTALINLKTFKRIEVEFPEAIPFLPKNGTTALAVNVDNIRKQLR